MKKLLVMFGFLSGMVYADSQVLNNFLATAKTLKANFTQTVITNKKPHVSQGKMEISRPNKFRWEYTSEEQLIVSDAKQIYIYDKPLQQVTVKPLGQSIDKSPAALLAGANNINQQYIVSDLPLMKDNDLTWVKIEPKNKDGDNNGFQLILMGFDKANKLSEMKFTDTFLNQTTLKFTNLQAGVSLPARDFKFTPPAGVDVVTQ